MKNSKLKLFKRRLLNSINLVYILYVSCMGLLAYAESMLLNNPQQTISFLLPMGFYIVCAFLVGAVFITSVYVFLEHIAKDFYKYWFTGWATLENETTNYAVLKEETI